MPRKSFDLYDDVEVEEKNERAVGRLTDMETREVSVVDRAANKRRFLVVKGEGEIMADQNDDKTDGGTTGTLTKNAISEAISEACDLVALAKVGIEEAEKTAKASLSEDFIRDLRSLQLLVKSMTGVTKRGFVAFAPSGFDAVEKLDGSTKKAVLKTLSEAERRLEAMKAETLEVEVLDADQSTRLEAVSDLIGKAALEGQDPSSPVVLAESLEDDQRVAILDAVEKAMDELGALYVALKTKGKVEKGRRLASASDVGLKLHSAAGQVEKAVRDVLKSEDSRASLSLGVEDLRDLEAVFSLAVDGRAIEKSEDRAAVMEARAEVEKAVRGVVSEVVKAAQMYCARWKEGGARVVLSTADQTVAEYDTYQEAEMEALRRNMEMVSGVAKAATEVQKALVVRAGGKGFQVVNTETGKVVWDGEDEEEAKAFVAGQGTSKSDTQDPEEGDVDGESDKEDTKKVGRPMQSDRLERLKAAVSLLKDALSDLRAGSVSLEKFKKVGGVLSGIITELSTAKSVTHRTGMDDPGGMTPDKPNVGSGVQPDASVVGDVEDVIGEGTPSIGDVLKRLKSIEAKGLEEVSKRDAEIRELKEELKKRRDTVRAPSAPPEDSASGTSEDLSKADDGYWPMDMNSQLGRKS